MKDVTGEKKVSPKTGVPGLKLYPGLSGSAGVFSGSVCKPSGSASDVLFANIYVSRFLFA